MKKNFKFYATCWAVLFTIYNLVVFLVQPIIPGYVIHYDFRFWIAWVVILAAFAGQLFCAKMAFDSKNNEKFFLNLPLITESYSALIAITIIGSVLMLIPDFPAWVTAIICAAIFGFSAVSIVKAKAATEIVGKIDDKINAKTSFIKSMTVNALGLQERATTDEIREECKRVAEAIRFSDPMSSDALATVEEQITLSFSALSEAVAAENAESVKKSAKEILVFISDRNNKCRLLK